MESTVLEVQSLSKSFKDTMAVRNISFSLQRGEVFGFLGPNGAGKSTTIRCILDIIRPSKGSIKLFGQDSTRDAVVAHKQVGYAANDMELYTNLTGEQYLRFMGHLQSQYNKTYVHSLSKKLQANLHKRIGELSRGNAIKIGLIAAMAHKPDLLILDEPTTGLDPLIQQQFAKLIEEHKKRGGTAFISSHVLPEVEQLCDRVGFINNGHLIEVATLDSLRVKSVREVHVTFAEPVKATELRKIKGVKEVGVDGRFATISIEGQLDALIKGLAQHTVVNLVSRDLDLEEVFLRFYGKRKR